MGLLVCPGGRPHRLRYCHRAYSSAGAGHRVKSGAKKRDLTRQRREDRWRQGRQISPTDEQAPAYQVRALSACEDVRERSPQYFGIVGGVDGGICGALRVSRKPSAEIQGKPLSGAATSRNSAMASCFISGHEKAPGAVSPGATVRFLWTRQIGSDCTTAIS